MVKALSGFAMVLGVSLSGLASSSASSYSCVGYDPFWQAEVSDDSIQVQGMVAAEDFQTILNVSGAFGEKEDWIKVYSGLYGPAAIVTKTLCQDSISPRLKQAEHEIFLFTAMGSTHGCCQQSQNAKP